MKTSDNLKRERILHKGRRSDAIFFGGGRKKINEWSMKYLLEWRSLGRGAGAWRQDAVVAGAIVDTLVAAWAVGALVGWARIVRLLPPQLAARTRRRRHGGGAGAGRAAGEAGAAVAVENVLAESSSVSPRSSVVVCVPNAWAPFFFLLRGNSIQRVANTSFLNLCRTQSFGLVWFESDYFC